MEVKTDSKNSGPGFKQRLEALEAQIVEHRCKFDQIQIKYEALERWKVSIEEWMQKNFEFAADLVVTNHSSEENNMTAEVQIPWEYNPTEKPADSSSELPASSGIVNLTDENVAGSEGLLNLEEGSISDDIVHPISQKLKRKRSLVESDDYVPIIPDFIVTGSRCQAPSTSTSFSNIEEDEIEEVHTSLITVKEEAPCNICNKVDWESNDLMIFCDKCNVCVHQACYGIRLIPEGSWLCNPCRLGLAPGTVSCRLCPFMGGALKPVRSPAMNTWAHVSCALWIKEVKFGNFRRMEPVIHINNIPLKRWNLKCYLCAIKTGAPIQCRYKKCRLAFHVTCALQHGLKLQMIEDPNQPDECKMTPYCKLHSKEGKRNNNKSLSRKRFNVIRGRHQKVKSCASSLTSFNILN